MIIGNGDIASVLPDRDDLIFFASGVSNSQETRSSEYKREVDLMIRQPRNKRLVYFSSLSVFYSKSRYANHKRAMEAMIKKYQKYYCIIRLGNIDWGDNPHTLINYFRIERKQGRTPQIRDEYRFICEKDELLFWINMIPPWNCEMNIPGRRMTVREIYDEYVT
jgi:hypothetical protein